MTSMSRDTTAPGAGGAEREHKDVEEPDGKTLAVTAEISDAGDGGDDDG